MKALLCAALAVLVLGCSPDSLQGSLTDQTSLDFTSVTVEVSGSSVAVSYLDTLKGTTTPNIVLEIVADTTGVSLTKGGTLNLTDTLANGMPRGQINRAVSGDSRTQFPPIVRGSLMFDQDPTVGAKVSGQFNVLWGQGGDIGEGRTAFGTFSAVVTAAGD